MAIDTVCTRDDFTVVTNIMQYLIELDGSVSQAVFDFTEPACELAAWGALDDVVMGGISQGSFFCRDGGDFERAGSASRQNDRARRRAVFAGNVSTDNSGGFSSVRTQNFEPPFNFAGWEGMRLHVRGDGQRYKFILRNSSGWDSPAYIYSFDTVANTWIDIYVPFTEMVATFRARSVPDAPDFDPKKVFSFQLMLSKFEYDRQLNPQFQPGPFELEVGTISAYRQRQGIALAIIGNHERGAAEQPQARSTETQVPCCWIDPDQTQSDLVRTLVSALAS